MRERVRVRARDRERDGERERNVGRDNERNRERDAREREYERQRGRPRFRVQQRRTVDSHSVGVRHRTDDTQRRDENNLQEGQWIEVRSRRKVRAEARIVTGGDQRRKNELQHGKSSGSFRPSTWRSRPDITSFYFAHFPDYIREKDLWKIFQEWGQVWEVFIPKMKNKQGLRFGFVCFKGVEDADSLERRLDNNIFIEGMKLFVNKPRFQRGRNKDDNTYAGKANGTEMKIMERRELENRRYKSISFPRLKSYVEVVKDNKLKEGKIPKELTSGEVATEAKKDLITFQTSKTNTSWLDNIWVGRLKNKAIFENVDEEVQGILGKEMKSTYWGDDMILLHNLEEAKAQELICREKESGGTPFTSIKRWSSDLQPSHRLTWLLIWGVPLKAWDAEFFAMLVSS